MQRPCVARRVGADTPRWFFKNNCRQATSDVALRRAQARGFRACRPLLLSTEPLPVSPDLLDYDVGIAEIGGHDGGVGQATSGGRRMPDGAEIGE